MGNAVELADHPQRHVDARRHTGRGDDVAVADVPQEINGAAALRPVYLLDDPRTEVYVGDCREVLSTIRPKSVDLAFADPPAAA